MNVEPEYDECPHGVPGGNDCIECLRIHHRDEIRAMESALIELEAIIEAMQDALSGQPVSEFMESFPPVRIAMEVRAQADGR